MAAKARREALAVRHDDGSTGCSNCGYRFAFDVSITPAGNDPRLKCRCGAWVRLERTAKVR